MKSVEVDAGRGSVPDGELQRNKAKSGATPQQVDLVEATTEGRCTGTVLHHTDNLATVNDPIQALCVDFAINTFSNNKFVPPSEQKVACNKLEPWREGVFWS